MLLKLFLILIMKSQAKEQLIVCKPNYTNVKGSCVISHQEQSCFVGTQKGITESYNGGINWQPCMKKKYVFDKTLKIYVASYELLGYDFSLNPKK